MADGHPRASDYGATRWQSKAGCGATHCAIEVGGFGKFARLDSFAHSPSRASGFAQWSSRSCQLFPNIEAVAYATCKPFAGGLLRSHSVGRNGLCYRKSFSQLPKLLKSQAAQVQDLQSDFSGRDSSHKICSVIFSESGTGVTKVAKVSLISMKGSPRRDEWL